MTGFVLIVMSKMSDFIMIRTKLDEQMSNKVRSERPTNKHKIQKLAAAPISCGFFVYGKIGGEDVPSTLTTCAKKGLFKMIWVENPPIRFINMVQRYRKDCDYVKHLFHQQFHRAHSL